MTERQTDYRAFSRMAWGYLFLFFDINLGSVSILPGFVGFLLFFSAIQVLAPKQRSLALLRPLCLLLAAYYLAQWVLSWFGSSWLEGFLFLTLLAAAVELYFHFQLLTDLADLAQLYQPPGRDLDQKLLNRRTVLVLLTTVGNLLLFLFPGSLEHSPLSLGLLAFLSFLVALFVMTALFSLRRCYWEATELPS